MHKCARPNRTRELTYGGLADLQPTRSRLKYYNKECYALWMSFPEFYFLGHLGPVSTLFLGVGIPIMKKRGSHNSFLLITWILVLVRQLIYIEVAPGFQIATQKKPVWHRVITWTNANMLSIGPFGTNFSRNWIKIQIFKEDYLQMPFVKSWYFSFRPNTLKIIYNNNSSNPDVFIIQSICSILKELPTLISRHTSLYKVTDQITVNLALSVHIEP